MKTLTIALILIASTAHATPWTIQDGNGGWKDNPECGPKCHETGVPDKPTTTPGDDRDPQPATTEQHYGFCCHVDGVVRYHTAFGRDDATARAQCTARAVKPQCPADLARMIKGADK